jgi:predicted GH43/DUF377 family glycosyl hydrolase
MQKWRDLQKIVERLESLLYRATSIMKKRGWRSERVKIEETYYVTYTAYDGINVMGALATSKDLIHFEKHGIITLL